MATKDRWDDDPDAPARVVVPKQRAGVRDQLDDLKSKVTQAAKTPPPPPKPGEASTSMTPTGVARRNTTLPPGPVSPRTITPLTPDEAAREAVRSADDVSQRWPANARKHVILRTHCAGWYEGSV